MRRTSKRPCQPEKNTGASSVFFFDLCSDVESSDDNTSLSTAQTEQEKLLGPNKTSCKHIEAPCNKSDVKKFSDGNLKVSSTVNPPVQRSITSYGKIKKDNTSELAKIGTLWKSPKTPVASQVSPDCRVMSPKLRFKVRNPNLWYV